ncbi:DUF1579 family protein [Candidatus Uabimicrobium amorphum]|uniref:DUF1794 domain-containing protein n=1 Tax=Uabimicrobium amorphum TaxID=2596890 RepID=A0A5S9IMR8_UABAM|nr:DUF1579 family protein [Candidatus Uabimicrobium amorphum]BBM84296.1 hypothetical protein UABAM_02653 [Candidatus Uabimicrobium amorphum]
MLRKIVCITFIFCTAMVYAQNEKLLKMMMPNENHAKLGSLVGFWDATCSVYGGNGKVVYEETGFCENKWMLGERFVLLEHMFTSFHTAAVVGYDNFLQSYTAAHIDSESPGIHHFIGDVSEEGRKKTFVLRGESVGFDGELVSTIYVIEIANRNNYKLKVHYEIDDQHLKVIEINFSRLDDSTVRKAQKQINKFVANSFARTAMANSKLQALNPLVGEWKIESLIFDNAGNVLRVDQGQSHNRWIMMRKFVMMVSVMGGYASVSIVGFDKTKKAYVAAHADNVGTSIYHCEGGKKGKELKMFGTAMDYATGEKTELTQTITFQNINAYECEMYRERDKVGLGVSTTQLKAERLKK